MKLALPLLALLTIAAFTGCSSEAQLADPQPAPEPEPTTVSVSETPALASPTEPPGVLPTTSAVVEATTSAQVSRFGAEWPNRFCVDRRVVETTLNLRAGPSIDTEVLASIPRFSCNLVAGDQPPENAFQPITYTTIDGATEGWASNNFITFQDPPDAMSAAALLFVEAWQLGIDTSQYSYGVENLPAPITNGHPVVRETDEFGQQGGCELVGDITISCDVVLVENDGTVVARIRLGATQRGVNGYEGESFWPADFPDGPTITSFDIVTDS